MKGEARHPRKAMSFKQCEVAISSFGSRREVMAGGRGVDMGRRQRWIRRGVEEV